MTFIELKRGTGTRFLYDPVTQWEIDDHGPDKPAWWSNHNLGANKDCSDTYEVVKAQLLGGAHEALLLQLAAQAMQGLLAGMTKDYSAYSRDDLAEEALWRAKALVKMLAANTKPDGEA